MELTNRETRVRVVLSRERTFPAMKRALHCIIVLRASLAVAIFAFLSPGHILAGRNAGGAIILHTNDSVAYTYTGQYCSFDFDNPGTCVQANTRTDLAGTGADAVIWALAAFPSDSDPAVTSVAFGIRLSNRPDFTYMVDDHRSCGGLELPLDDWPNPNDLTSGTLITYGSPPIRERLFPVVLVRGLRGLGRYVIQHDAVSRRPCCVR